MTRKNTEGDLSGAQSRESPEAAAEHRDAGRGRGLARRDFLAASAAAVGTFAFGTRTDALGVLARPGGTAPTPIGLQLYTLRDLMGQNLENTLAQVAAVGYKEVEFAGLFDKEPTKVRRTLDKLGLKSPSSHIPYARLQKNLPGVVDEARTLGNEFIVCPWIDAPQRRDAASWHRIAADFNRFGEAVRRAGFQFGYHNHDFEFQKLPGGEIGYDILLKDCDPKLVKMELDLYWITKAGGDPLAYFAKWPGRFPLVHVKDMSGDGKIVNVGQGRIDWGRIFAKRREAGIEHLIVENDNPTQPMADIKASYTYLSRLGL